MQSCSNYHTIRFSPLKDLQTLGLESKILELPDRNNKGSLYPCWHRTTPFQTTVLNTKCHAVCLLSPVKTFPRALALKTPKQP